MVEFGKEFNYYCRSLIRIIYPANCVLCKIPLVLDETYLCIKCFETIEPLKKPVCVKCAHLLPPYGTERSLCSNCRSERPYYNRGFALVKYDDRTKSIFHQIKFQKKFWLMNIFSKLITCFSSSAELANYDMIVPVPLDPRRERERGFNQARIIAQILKQANKKNAILISDALIKRKKTPSQSQLKRQERLVNLEGAFSAKKRGYVRGKHVLLVDDIFTTGSTMNECAKILKEDGAERVDFLAIARSSSI